jgi:hypothetical protein
VEQALNEQTRISLENVSLGEALRTITDQTGVEIVIAPEVLALVPGGVDTVIQKVNISNVSLREGLSDLFRPLGLTLAVREGFVEIVATEAVRCLGRVPTWDELTTIEELRTMAPGADEEALGRLRKRVQFHIRTSESWSMLAETLRGVGAGPGDEVLSIACEKLGWAWCVSGEKIVITGREQDIVRRLRQPIAAHVSAAEFFSRRSGSDGRAGLGNHRGIYRTWLSD